MQHQHCRQNDTQAAEPCADGTLLFVTLLIMIVARVSVILSGEGGKQKNRKVASEYRQGEHDNGMNPFEGKIHPYRLRKNTELTGIRLVVYENRPDSSSERKPECSRKYGGAFGE
ncbi:MAG: hypothetical protein OXU79_13435 [Gemmatimonadota bacterium]|nr:hypothetical protein [Gemmatimonadota bacterium]